MFHPDHLLTEAEVEDILGVSRTTLWRLRTRGDIPFVRVGSNVRYEPAALEAWLAQQSAEEHHDEVPLDEPRDDSEREWKRILDDSDWAFEDERTDEWTHNLHPYPAKFPPQIPRRLINVLTSPGDTVLDPFCGSGTTLVEARALGRSSIGIDSNPVAVLASLAKTLVLDSPGFSALDGLDKAVEADISRITGQPILMATVTPDIAPVTPPQIPNRERWFTPQAMHELGMILARVDELAHPSAATVARACFSAILVQASNQDSETRYTARAKTVEVGDVLRRFREKLMHTVRMHRGWLRGASSSAATALVGDARQLDASEIGLVDAVITSPPYANAFDYHLYHRHRLYWLGFDPKQVREAEIGSHLNHQGQANAISIYQDDLRECLASVMTCLQPRRPIAFVVGDSVFGGRLVNNAVVLSGVSRRLGLRTIACVGRVIHPRKRSMIHAARRARKEHILLLVKE